MNFREIIKEYNEIYFDNKDDLKEFLDLCSKENIKWGNDTKAKDWKGIWYYYERYGNFISIRINFYKTWYLTQTNDKIDFTYNDFKKLLKSFDFIEFLSSTAVNVKDEKQFDYMYSLLKYNKVPFVYEWKNHYSSYKEHCCVLYDKDNEGIIVSSTIYNDAYISFQDFISIYNFNTINKKVEELNITSLKQDIEKYLIKNREATTEFNDLLDFIIDVNNKYDLKLNI